MLVRLVVLAGPPGGVRAAMLAGPPGGVRAAMAAGVAAVTTVVLVRFVVLVRLGHGHGLGCDSGGVDSDSGDTGDNCRLEHWDIVI